MSTNWFSSNKTSNCLMIFLSLVLHIVLLVGVILIKPFNRVAEKTKLFDLIEIQMGIPQTIKTASPPLQQPTKTHPTTLKKQAINDQLTKEPSSKTTAPTAPLQTEDSTRKEQPPSQTSSGTEKEDTPDAISSTSKSPEVTTQSNTAIRTIDAGELGAKPIKIYGADPIYPLIAQDLGITGTVRAIITIDTSGTVKEVTIESSPHKSMSEEAVRTLLKWKFKPLMYKGMHVTVKRCIQELEFRE